MQGWRIEGWRRWEVDRAVGRRRQEEADRPQKYADELQKYADEL